MPLSNQTMKLLTSLAAEVVKEPQPLKELSGKWREIPPHLLSEPQARHHSRPTEGLRLSVDETRLYFSCLRELAHESELEHLLTSRRRERAVDDQLWALVCDLFANRQDYKDVRKRKQRLADFAAAIAKPHDLYEVVITVEHLQMAEHDFAIGDVTFSLFDDHRASAWGISDREHERDLVGKVVARTQVRAGTVNLALERAKTKTDTALNILRVCGAPMPLIHDDQLQQRRGQDWLAKNLSASDNPIRGGWQRGDAPIDLDLKGAIYDHFSEELLQLQPILSGKIPRDLNNRISRAFEWVGSSVTRRNYDDKVIDLCTALETLLTTINDAKKGEALALRVLLLAMAAEGEGLLLHPLEVLAIYEARSIVVHGSDLNICGKRDYVRLRTVTLDAIQQVATLATSVPTVTKISKLIATIQADANLGRAISWLEENSQSDVKQFKQLIKYANGLLNGPSRA